MPTRGELVRAAAAAKLAESVPSLEELKTALDSVYSQKLPGARWRDSFTVSPQKPGKKSVFSRLVEAGILEPHDAIWALRPYSIPDRKGYKIA